MYINNLKIIQMFRGDTLTLIPIIKTGTNMYPEHYELTEKDTIYFALMEVHQKFEDAILKKVFDNTSPTDVNNDLIIKLDSSDTVDLLPGKYYYTIKMKHINDDESFDVYTLLKETEFWILN